MEIEVDLQVPTCGMMVKKKDLRLHPECIWKNVNIQHWIEVMMRISRLDTNGVHGPIRTPHLLRVPIFNPPAFENNVAPPPAPETVNETPEIGLRTLPPHYDDVVGTPGAGGLVDYFSSLADYGLDGPDED
ncbi:hypothetical protein QSH57_004581 [Fusarium oxysporum f. sp. vasinfectum]|nr:hypothetical protein QSH57_004581 [Fusarium oxysporum f. sp. vasinfectum]